MKKLRKYLTFTEVRNKASQAGVKIFTPLDFSRLMKVSKRQATLFLSRNAKKGKIIRANKGIYYFSDFAPSAFEIANILYRPSYISVDTAMSYYKIIPETVYAVTSMTTKHSRSFVVNNQELGYQQLARPLYFGYKSVSMDGSYVLIAEKEKALLDFLYFVAQGKRLMNDRIDMGKIDVHTLQALQVLFLEKIKNRLFTTKLERLVAALLHHA